MYVCLFVCVCIHVCTEDCAESPGHAKTLASEEDPNFIERALSEGVLASTTFGAVLRTA